MRLKSQARMISAHLSRFDFAHCANRFLLCIFPEQFAIRQESEKLEVYFRSLLNAIVAVPRQGSHI